MKDPLGNALLKYFESGEEQRLLVRSKDVHTDEYKASYFFRNYTEMPIQEQRALHLCRGRVLDVGAGAGCHTLWLQEKGFNVAAIDTSKGAVETMKLREVVHVTQEPIMQHVGKYDTILLLMNGIGLAGKIKELPDFLEYLKSLLAPGSQVLADSSDIFHLYDSLDADELLDFDKDYLGEVAFQFEFQNERSNWFNWLYLDQRTFSEYAIKAGFQFKIIHSKENSGYLVQLSLY